MPKRGNFFMVQKGYKQSFWDYIGTTMKMVSEIENDKGRIDRAKLRKFMRRIDFIKPYLDWKTKPEYEALDRMLDSVLRRRCPAAFVLEIYKKRLSLYMRLARSEPMDLLADMPVKPTTFGDTETGETMDEPPDGWIDAEG